MLNITAAQFQETRMTRLVKNGKINQHAPVGRLDLTSGTSTVSPACGTIVRHRLRSIDSQAVAGRATRQESKDTDDFLAIPRSPKGR